MSFDSKKTILLEKTYLYVRASLGFQLEGTSTEKIPTNNGFYRFFVDNLQKAIGNSYVNILYDSQDLTLQCFCSDLYMDELMSSDSSAIEDVVAELKKNTSTIVEFESGVSSALESNHQDNVALNAKLEEFETGVSSALAANHEDNVLLNTSINSIVPLLLKAPYFSNFPLRFCYQGFEMVRINSELFSKFDFSHLSKGNDGSARTAWNEYSLFVNSVNCGFNYFDNKKGTNIYGFHFKFKYPYNGPSFIRDSDFGFALYDIKNFKKLNSINRVTLSEKSLSINDQLNWETKMKGINQLLYFLSIPQYEFQIISSLCAFDTPKQNFLIADLDSSGGSSVIGAVRKYNGLIPCDLGFHDFTKSYKGLLQVFFSDCNSDDFDFIKKCDFEFMFTSGVTTVVHVYDCNPNFNNGIVTFGSYPIFNSNNQTDFLCGINLVYTGVSSAS